MSTHPAWAHTCPLFQHPGHHRAHLLCLVPAQGQQQNSSAPNTNTWGQDAANESHVSPRRAPGPSRAVAALSHLACRRSGAGAETRPGHHGGQDWEAGLRDTFPLNARKRAPRSSHASEVKRCPRPFIRNKARPIENSVSGSPVSTFQLVQGQLFKTENQRALSGRFPGTEATGEHSNPHLRAA